ncbi:MULTISPECIES: ogr/Delta-like zinc finger family protein [unclassified Halomonas]|uniref:ogr/Delta-like zinc finger family protein n=1 Tax=unclassified Halomonas TaxID=2609666 RepID=UPI001CF11BFD|nr:MULTISPECIES: ogr/Delta-like zinc finger family protein [unclassified Halomonas]MCA8865579.1 ogr/Delta-like zinc finger family protein [Halomonas sp. SBBP1]UZH10437.1 ogr/Delta-like zinc finger family protein [Halomonas sp. BDJS001]
MTEPEEQDDELEGVPTNEVSRLRIGCPHCGSYMKVRTSKTHLPDYRELYLNCTNEFACGFRCKASLGIIEEIVPSYQPNPDVNIKQGAWLKRQIRLEEQGQMRLGIENITKPIGNHHERRTH